jgi:uncharacterized protein (DUF362 family)
VNSDLHKTEFTRRQFLVRSARAGASIVAAGAAGFWFYDTQPPTGSQRQDQYWRLPDFSVPGLEKKMCIVRGADRAKTLQLALKTLGGLEQFITKGDRVLLKVNAAFASPPLLSATTHPQVVSEITKLCYRAGASLVTVADNPINDPASCFGLTGIAEAAKSNGARVILPKEHFFKPVTVPDAKLIRDWPVLYEPLNEINRVIGISPVKDHHRSGASMAMKNWYGLLGGRRNIFHQDIHNIIKELVMMVTPTLVILDGTTSMMTNGPTGGSLSDLKQTNTMIVSTDQVAAEAVGAGLLGKRISHLPYIAKAEAKGVGTADYQSLNPIELTI